MTTRLSPRDILETLVGFPTVSRDTNVPLIDWVEGYLQGHGITCHRHWDETGEKAALFAHVGPDQDGGVILSGHTDVVPVDGQEWTSSPWELTERDGRLYGRGSTDMKAFDALAIWALVEAQYLGLSRPIQIALSYDEEIGCTGAPPLIDAMQGVVPRADVAIIGEPTMMGAVTGHKGGVSFHVHVHGVEVHSSILHKGVSAIMYGAELITWANRVNDAQMAAMPSEMAALFDPPCTNVHVGTINGGTAHNITAKDCEFHLGFRIIPGESPDTWREAFFEEVRRVEAQMQAVCPEAWIEVSETFTLPAFAPTQNNLAEELVRQITGDNGQHQVSYGTEASHFQAAGYDAVVCGPGDIGIAHQPDEYIEISQLNAGQKFMERLLKACGA